jgi:hypothetical protein
MVAGLRSAAGGKSFGPCRQARHRCPLRSAYRPGEADCKHRTSFDGKTGMPSRRERQTVVAVGGKTAAMGQVGSGFTIWRANSALRKDGTCLRCWVWIACGSRRRPRKLLDFPAPGLASVQQFNANGPTDCFAHRRHSAPAAERRTQQFLRDVAGRPGWPAVGPGRSLRSSALLAPLQRLPQLPMRAP